ncbi:MAG: DHH family phosphoesterase [Paludibacteraceae bacterium]|nr:DHH family phosphoesterase [Paludibacteraceae bacterium]
MNKPNTPIAITGNQKFSDMDSFACIISYKELLKMSGVDATACIPGDLNVSVTPDIRQLDIDYEPEKNQKGSCKYIIVDVSDPEEIAEFTDDADIIKIIDHHFGYEVYWKERLGENAIIEPVGACATLIWEEYKKNKCASEISTISANLLSMAIVSNTLNFRASVTSKRDHEAFKQLKKYCDLREGWVEQYFKEQEAGLYKDIKKAILDDTKIRFNTVLGEKTAIGQLEMWDSRDLIEHKKGLIKEVLESFDLKNWYLTAPCIGLGYNLFYTDVKETKELLEKFLKVRFEGDVGRNDKLLLRKEILKIFNAC